MAPAALAAKSPTAPQQRNRKLQPCLPAALTIAGGALALGCWLVARRRRRAGQQRAKAVKAQAERAALQAGDVVDLQIPIRPTKAPQLPFLPPKALGTVLADVTLPGVPLSALWRAAFANDAGFLVAFHTARRDYDIALTPWRTTGSAALATRTLEYITPLSNPLGPRQARNTEVMECTSLGACGFVLQTRCTTEGVPFAGNFANYLQWVGYTDLSGATRLVVTGECRFHNQVWGPLRGKIESESVKGMAKAYAQFSRMLQEQLLKGGNGSGGTPASAGGEVTIKAVGGPAAGSTVPPGDLPSPRTLAAMLTANSQQGTATILLLVIMGALLYRMSLGDSVALSQSGTMAVQLLRRWTGQYLAMAGVPAAGAP